jgi:hypothetical protein
LHAIAVAQAKANDVPAALATADRIGDEAYRAFARRDIALARARAGDIAGARRMAAGLGDDFFEYAETGEVLRQIGAIEAKAGGGGDAVAYASSQREPAVRALGLLGAAEGMLDRLGRGRPQPALRRPSEDLDE